MLSTEDYRRAVAAAYRVREEYDTGSLAFDPFLPLSVMEGVRVCKYSTLVKMCQDANAPVPMGDGVSGGTVLIPNIGKLVVYNDAERPNRQRHTLSHELGHIILGHREDSDYNDEMADCFARNLLCPAALVQRYGIPPRLLPQLFRISPAAARMAERHYAADLAAVWPSTREKMREG